MADEKINLYNIDFSKIESLDQFYALTQPIGSIEQGNSNALYGINHTQVKNSVPENRDSKGYVFFTRPQLNLSLGNLVNLRHFYNLSTTDNKTIHRYVRDMLDPRLCVSSGAQASPMVDPNLAFIPILTNTLEDMSGWPDIVMNAFTSKSGIRKEQYIQIDSSSDIYESFDLDCTFRNTRNEPILLMIQTWLMYAGAVFEGIMVPYIDMIIENEIDYNTRIYRLVMDETDTYVVKIAAVGASFPINVPTGKVFDFSNTTKYATNNKELNIRFKCVGAMYNDPILVKEFNYTSIIFNPDLEKIVTAGFKNVGNYEKIPRQLKDQLNHRGYPLINENTFELEWWIDTGKTVSIINAKGDKEKRAGTYSNVMGKVVKSEGSSLLTNTFKNPNDKGKS